MTATNRTKTFARRIQQISDLTYQQALAALDELFGRPAYRDEEGWFWPDWHRQVVWMACMAAADAARRAVPDAVVHEPALGGHDGDHIHVNLPATSQVTGVAVTFLDTTSPEGDTTLDVGFTTYSRPETGEDVGSFALLRRDGTPMIIDDLLLDEHWDWLVRALSACFAEFASVRANDARPSVDGIAVLGPNCL